MEFAKMMPEPDQGGRKLNLTETLWHRKERELKKSESQYERVRMTRIFVERTLLVRGFLALRLRT